MADVGRELADRELRKLERKLAREYAQAEKELRKEYEKFVKEYASEFKRKWKLVQEGKLSEQNFSHWLEKQSLHNSWANDMIRKMADEQVNANKRAAEIINGYMPKVYAEAYNFGTFMIESVGGIDTAFTLYNADAVARLMKKNTKLLPKASVDIAKDRRWNQQHIRSALTQSILQGDGIAKMSKRLLKAGMIATKPEDIKGWKLLSPKKLAREVERRNKVAAIRNARTMMVGAENGGRFDSFQRAIGLGIEMKKMWSATMDSRTRDSHAVLDGETVELDEKFSNGLIYPGDPDGAPGEVYNCRCRLSAQLAGFERNNRHIVDGEHVTEEDYLNWKKAHGEFAKVDGKWQKVVKENNKEIIKSAKQYSVGYHEKNNYSAALFDAFTVDEKNALISYTSGRFERINNILRGIQEVDESKINPIEAIENIKAMKSIDGCTSALSKSILADDTILYRGMGDMKSLSTAMGIDDNVLKQMLDSKDIIGQSFIEKAFCSTAIDAKTMRANEINLKILAPKGTKGMYVDPISLAKGEHEVLLQRGTRFEIVEVKKNGKRYDLTVVIK